MPSYGVDDLLRTLARPSSQLPLGEVCAGGVSKHQKATCTSVCPLVFYYTKISHGWQSPVECASL